MTTTLLGELFRRIDAQIEAVQSELATLPWYRFVRRSALESRLSKLHWSRKLLEIDTDCINDHNWAIFDPDVAREYTSAYVPGDGNQERMISQVLSQSA